MSPEPMRKMKTNEPANVAYVAGFLAALRGMPLEQFAQTTTSNAARFFGLDVHSPFRSRSPRPSRRILAPS